MLSIFIKRSFQDFVSLFILQQAAEEFYQLFNGVPFNSLEPDFVCNLVFVRRVEVLGENNNGAIPPSGHTELPICPVCLERMDESVDGILTILCNHSFHGTCIAKWGDIRSVGNFEFQF